MKCGIKNCGPHSNPSAFQLYANAGQLFPKNIHVGFSFSVNKHTLLFSTSTHNRPIWIIDLINGSQYFLPKCASFQTPDLNFAS